MKIVEIIKSMVNKKGIEESVQQEEEVIYPRFLSTIPHGEDLFEGKSQERIKSAIEQYVLNTDNPRINMSEDKLPRLIGIEGEWGSGKSNVIKMLENDSVLKDNYIFFTYDAWGNQEDLQRKSILLMLTQRLIRDNYLVGTTKMLQYNPQENTEPTYKDCSWEERLQSLTSNKSYTREISVPSINDSTKWFGLVLALMGLLIGILQIDGALAWWVNVIISISPLILFFILLACLSKDSFKTACIKMFAMYETGAKTDTTSYVISEEEPTVTEFKNWMQDLSKSLLNGKKLVIVFDNMDRLSKEKVLSLWSSIHTFFADSNIAYENVWCIIPFDAKHLALAFDEKYNEQKDLLKRFLQKTFPIVYHVPEPIITDYKDVVDTLLKRAFAEKLHDQDCDIINRCYRLTYSEPNVREIIAFINELVQMYHTWNNEKIDIVSIAVYVLQKHKIDNENDKNSVVSKELFIIDKKYEENYVGALKSSDSETMQRNIAALHYGVRPDKAYTITLKRVLNDILGGGQPDEYALVPYLSNKEQLSILEEVFYELDPSKYGSVIKYFISVEEKEISKEAKKMLGKFWNHMASDFLDATEAVSNISDYHIHLIEHLSNDRQKECATYLIKRLFATASIKGDSLFHNLNMFFEQPFAKKWNIGSVCPKLSLVPEEYINFVHAAQNNFVNYPIGTNEAKLNEYLQSLITDDFVRTEEVKLLKDAYDLKPFVDKTVEVLSESKSEAKLVGKLLQIQRIYFNKFQNTKLATSYIQQLWNSVNGQPSLECYPEVLALQAFRIV